MDATLVRMGRPKKDEPTEPVRIPRSVLKRVKRLASHFDKDPGDYLAKLLGPLLDKDEAKMLSDIEREQKDNHPRKS